MGLLSHPPPLHKEADAADGLKNAASALADLWNTVLEGTPRKAAMAGSEPHHTLP